MPFPTRPLGRNGPPVTAVGVGLMGLSRFYGAVGTEEERLAFLDHVYASGERFWDTADMYGDSEDLLGTWFRRNPGARQTIFLATKFGNVATGGVRSDPAYVREALARSLARLGVDHVDLYYVHRVDQVTPIEDTVDALVALKNEGKIRHLGLSEVTADTIRRAQAVHPITAFQIEYSPFETLIEKPSTGLLATCRELGIAVVAYSPLGRGLLTGRYRSTADFPAGDFRTLAPRFADPDNLAHNLKLVDAIAALADAKACSPGQLTLAWLASQGPDIFPIPGTKKAAYFDENVGAMAVQLTDAEVAQVRAAVDAAEIAGARYPAATTKWLLGSTPPRK